MGNETDYTLWTPSRKKTYDQFDDTNHLEWPQIEFDSQNFILVYVLKVLDTNAHRIVCNVTFLVNNIYQ